MGTYDCKIINRKISRKRRISRGGGNLSSGYNSVAFSDTTFSIYKPNASASNPPDKVDPLSIPTLRQSSTTSCTVTLSRNASGSWDKTKNIKEDFSVHCVPSTNTSPYWSAGTQFNCIVTNYNSDSGVLSFNAIPAFASPCKFVIIVRNEQGTGMFSAELVTESPYFEVEAPAAAMITAAFASARTSAWTDFTAAYKSDICRNYPANVKLYYSWQETGTSIPPWRSHYNGGGTLSAMVDGNSPITSNVASSTHLWGNVNASRYLYGTPLWRLMWYFPQKRTMKSLVIMVRQVWKSEYVKFEIVASNDNLNFVRLPTKWNVGGQVLEDTFSLDKQRVDWNGNDLWRVAVDGTSINAHKFSASIASASGKYWLDTTHPCVLAEILVSNDAQYNYYGFGCVGSDCPHTNHLRNSNDRRYARFPCGSAYIADGRYDDPAGLPGREDIQWHHAMYTLAEDNGRANQWQWMPSMNNGGFSWNIAIPQVVTAASAELTTYKYWRIRATSAFLGACGTATKAYFWKLGLYRNAAVAAADTLGISSNNFLQQHANVLGISTNGTTPTTQPAGGTKRDSMFVSKGDWTQQWGSLTQFALVDGSTALRNNAVDVTFNAELACIHFTLDVAGVIGAIRFPDNMYYDANVRGGTFIIEAATASAPTTWVTMVAESSGKYLGREGILNATPVASGASGNVALATGYKIFSITPRQAYVWPTTLSAPVIGAGSLSYNVNATCTITLSGSGWVSTDHTSQDFNVHLVASNASPPYWAPGTTKFNCTVTNYTKNTGVLEFTVTPVIIGDVAFAVFVRSGDGSGVLGTPILSSPLSIVDSSMFYVYPSTDILTFNGSSDFINIGNLGTVGSTYTIELWLKYAITQDYRNPCDMNYSTYSGLGNAGPRFEFGYWLWGGSSVSDSAYANTTQSVMSTNVWYYVAMTMNSGIVNSYFNGSIVSTNMASSASGYFTTFGSVSLGRGSQPQGTARYFNGSIANFKIYKRVLSSSEIAQNFTANRSQFGI